MRPSLAPGLISRYAAAEVKLRHLRSDAREGARRHHPKRYQAAHRSGDRTGEERRKRQVGPLGAHCARTHHHARGGDQAGAMATTTDLKLIPTIRAAKPIMMAENRAFEPALAQATATMPWGATAMTTATRTGI